MLVARQFAVALVVSVFSVGCFSASPGQSSRATPANATTVLVENRHHEDVRVFLMRGVGRIELGVVTAMRARRFRVLASEWGSGMELRLAAEAFSSHIHRMSEPFSAPVGAEVEWTVLVQLKHANLVLR